MSLEQRLVQFAAKIGLDIDALSYRSSKNFNLPSNTSSFSVDTRSSRTFVRINELANNLAINNPVNNSDLLDGDTITFAIKDNGTSRVLTFGSSYRDAGAGLPTTTVAGKLMHLGFIHNVNDSKWDLVSKVVSP